MQKPEIQKGAAPSCEQWEVRGIAVTGDLPSCSQYYCLELRLLVHTSKYVLPQMLCI